MNSSLVRVTICTVALALLGFARAEATLIPLGEYPMGGTYSGIVPCSDCAGIWTELTLNDTGVDAGQGKGTFVMTERFTGGVNRGDVVTERGSWSTVAWVQGQSFTGTVELRYAKPDGTDAPPLYFYCDHGRYLRLIAERSSAFAFAAARPRFFPLQRVIPRGRFGPLTDKDAGRAIYARVGDEFEVTLPAPLADSTLGFWTIARGSARNIVTTGPWGSGNGDQYSSGFILKAVAPGNASVVFRSGDKQARTVTFSFEIAP